MGQLSIFELLPAIRFSHEGADKIPLIGHIA